MSNLAHFAVHSNLVLGADPAKTAPPTAAPTAAPAAATGSAAPAPAAGPVAKPVAAPAAATAAPTAAKTTATVQQAAGPQQKKGPSGIAAFFASPIFLLILMFVVFYFLLIRPQQKKQKAHQRMLSELKKGDDIVTASGIFGRITGMTDTVATIEIADKVRIKILRSQIAGTQGSQATAPDGKGAPVAAGQK